MESLWSRIEICMTTRRMFACSIVALLVVTSALSLACGLSCSFASMNSDCHSLQAETRDSADGGMQMGGIAMAGMTMPEMAVGEKHQTASTFTPANAGHPLIGETGMCGMHSCDNATAVSSRANHSVDSALHSLVAKFVSSTGLIPPQLFRDARDDIPHDPPGDASPFSLSLRI